MTAINKKMIGFILLALIVLTSCNYSDYIHESDYASTTDEDILTSVQTVHEHNYNLYEIDFANESSVEDAERNGDLCSSEDYIEEDANDEFTAEVVHVEHIIRPDPDGGEDIVAILEILLANYIYVTNGNETVETRRIRIGEEFLGLTLEEWIEGPGVSHVDGEFFQPISTAARFSGEIVLTGDLIIERNPDGKGVHVNRFYLSEYSLGDVPRLASYGYDGFVEINNSPVLLELLGIQEVGEDEHMFLRFDNITIRVNNFILSARGTDGFDSALIISVIDY